MPGPSEAEKGVLIHMLRALQNFVDSPKKKVVMSAIVAILLVGVKMSKDTQPPVEVKNMQKEKGKVRSRCTNHTGPRKRKCRSPFLEARVCSPKESYTELDLNRDAVSRVPVGAARYPHADEHLDRRRKRPDRQNHRGEKFRHVCSAGKCHVT